eukprot:Skav219977  [mRNA]  locus=scaffold137:9793:10192:- [translate_table: standard]
MPRSLQVICNDRIGRKIRVKCNPDDTIADLKKLIAAQHLSRCGTRWEKIRIQKWYNVYKEDMDGTGCFPLLILILIPNVKGPHHPGRL